MALGSGLGLVCGLGLGPVYSSNISILIFHAFSQYTVRGDDDDDDDDDVDLEEWLLYIDFLHHCVVWSRGESPAGNTCDVASKIIGLTLPTI